MNRSSNFSRSSGTILGKKSSSLPLRRRSHRRVHRRLSRGHRQMACQSSDERNVFLRLQRLLAPFDEVLCPRFSIAPEFFARSRALPHSPFPTLTHQFGLPFQPELFFPLDFQLPCAIINAVWNSVWSAGACSRFSGQPCFAGRFAQPTSMSFKINSLQNEN